MISLQYAIYYYERDAKGLKNPVSKSEDLLQRHHLHVTVKPDKKTPKNECTERKKCQDWKSYVRKYGSSVGKWYPHTIYIEFVATHTEGDI